MKPLLLLSFLLLACRAGGGAHAADPPPYGYLSPTIGYGSPGSRSGTAVARDGEWLAVGAPLYDDDDAAEAGSVAIYRWRGGRWKNLPSLTLRRLGNGVTEQSGAHFGAAVALSGGRLLVGCPGCASPRPKAYLVELTDPLDLPPAWYPLYPALISEADPDLGIGSAVAMSGTTVAVGAPLARASVQGVERGAVAIGHLDGDAVVWDDIVFGPETPAGSRFGYSLAMDVTAGATPLTGIRSLLVGAPAHVNPGGFGLAGRAWLYQRSAWLPGPWIFEQSFANPTNGISDAMGMSVALQRRSVDDTGLVVLGAPGRGTGGRVFVHARSPFDASYTFEREIEADDAASGDRFGIAVGVDDGRVLVGADRRHVDNDPDQGAAYLFERRALPGDVDWLPLQRLEFPGATNVNLGHSLAMSRSMAVLGAPSGPEERGMVVVYACDRIFADGIDAGSGEACALP